MSSNKWPMRERLARVIEKTFNDMGRVFDKDQAGWLTDAFIEELRTPTPEMLDAGCDHLAGHHTSPHLMRHKDKVLMIYKAMIEAAMKGDG